MSHETPDAAGRRKCPMDGYCVNLSNVKIELEGLKQKTSAEYAALERLVGELREMLVALPKEIAAQIEKGRKEVDHSFDKGDEDFKEIFRRLAKLEKAMIAIYILVGVITIGKGFAWLWSVFYHAG
jgi:hypothetical protein